HHPGPDAAEAPRILSAEDRPLWPTGGEADHHHRDPPHHRSEAAGPHPVAAALVPRHLSLLRPGADRNQGLALPLPPLLLPGGRLLFPRSRVVALVCTAREPGRSRR
ncbi:unnamed protein product, partial [Ectocarpus fasciculatus]